MAGSGRTYPCAQMVLLKANPGAPSRTLAALLTSSPSVGTELCCYVVKVSSPASTIVAGVQDALVTYVLRLAMNPQTKRTIIAPTMAPMSPAPSPGAYHPSACPR